MTQCKAARQEDEACIYNVADNQSYLQRHYKTKCLHQIIASHFYRNRTVALLLFDKCMGTTEK